MHIINIAQAGVITDAPSVSDIGMKVLFFLLSVAGIVSARWCEIFSCSWR